MTDSHQSGQAPDVRPRRLELIRSPEQPAFAEIFNREYAFVWRSLRHLGVALAELDDAAQDVFVVVFRRWKDYDDSRDVRGWLWGIAQRVARGRRRGADRHRRKLALVRFDDVDRRFEQSVERGDAADFVADFLSRLSSELRDVFVLVDIEGLTAPEVAHALGLNLNTVYSRVRVGRQRFAEAIDERRCVREREGIDNG
jgi:RNA polymerase sigma-70 factor (ECF subfamily)